MSTNKRNQISIGDKYSILQDIEKGVGYDLIVQKYGLKGRSNVSRILSSKESIEKCFESNQSKRKRLKKPKNQNLEEEVLKWFRSVRAQKISISGPLIRSKALEIAKELDIDFKASDGWLTKFRARHEIICGTVVGEAAGVDQTVVTDWVTTRLPQLIKEYKPRDVYNADELGLFWRLMPNKTMRFKGETCSSGKRPKERITVLLCANADGSDKRKILVIGHSAKPRGFSRLWEKSPIVYRSNKTAWMTITIWEEFLKNFNKSMAKQRRNVIIFVDNCTAHGYNFQMSNVKLIYLPPNTTLCSQPLDAGVIKTFKGYYRNELVKKLLAIIEAKQEVTNTSIPLIEAVLMAKTAWDSVQSHVIRKCFRKCGFVFDDLPTEELLSNENHNEFWAKTTNSLSINISFEEYAECDDDLMTSSETQFSNESTEIESSDCSERETEDIQTEDTMPSLLAISQSILTLKKFFLFNAQTDSKMLNNLDDIQNQAFKCHLITAKQSKITDFFK